MRKPRNGKQLPKGPLLFQTRRRRSLRRGKGCGTCGRKIWTFTVVVCFAAIGLVTQLGIHSSRFLSINGDHGSGSSQPNWDALFGRQRVSVSADHHAALEGNLMRGSSPVAMKGDTVESGKSKPSGGGKSDGKSESESESGPNSVDASDATKKAKGGDEREGKGHPANSAAVGNGSGGGAGGGGNTGRTTSHGLVGGFRDPADEVALTFGVGEGGVGPMEAFLAQGKKLPVLLLTCNRAKLLRQTLESLRNVRGMDMKRVMVLQDGSDEAVKTIVEEEGLYLKQHTATPGLRGGPRAGTDGAMRIAMHYKFALDHVFATEPEAPGVIIIEDDLLFSPDFLEYMEANAPVLERDPTTLVLSAWNDNGYKGRVSDKSELQRTLYFPGLGWLLSRKLFDEIGPRWPREHWDHWLRDKTQHRGRECVFPEVPRTYHNGIKGTFMDQKTHDRLFKNIDYNTDTTFSWPSSRAGAVEPPPPPFAKAMRDNYEGRVEARIRAAQHINNLDDLPTALTKKQDGGEVVMWYSLQQTEEAPGRMSTIPPFKPLADFFGIWHEYRRTEHNGMHTFRYEGGTHVMLINAAKSAYVSLKPERLIPATMGHLHGVGAAMADIRAVPGILPSMSCDTICNTKGMVCREGGFEALNSCPLLVEHLPCTTCEESYGEDQPCYVELGAPAGNFPGKCLVSSQPGHSQCSASHELTRRMCPCAPVG